MLRSKLAQNRRKINLKNIFEVIQRKRDVCSNSMNNMLPPKHNSQENAQHKMIFLNRIMIKCVTLSIGQRFSTEYTISKLSITVNYTFCCAMYFFLNEYTIEMCRHSIEKQ